MAEKLNSGDKKSENAMADALSELQSGGLGSLNWLGSVWVEKMSNLGAEWVRFLSGRLQEDVKVQHQLLHCKSLDEAQRIQAEFFQKAIEEYRAETGKLIELSTETGSQDEEDGKNGGPRPHHSTPV